MRLQFGEDLAHAGHAHPAKAAEVPSPDRPTELPQTVDDPTSSIGSTGLRTILVFGFFSGNQEDRLRITLDRELELPG